MNNTIKLSLIALTFSTLFISCSKDDDNTGTPGTPGPSNTTSVLSAKINGTAWAPHADSCTAFLMNGVINISGIAHDGKTITITLMDTVAGAYDLSATGNGAGVYNTQPSGGISYTSNSFNWPASVNKLTISNLDKVNKKMSGTFEYKAWSFSVNDSVTISEGQFTNLPYVTSISSTGNNSFSVTIDGSPFTPSLISGAITGSNLSIVASDNTGTKSVALFLPSNISTGTFSLQPFGTYNAAYNPNSTTYLVVSTGTVTITEHNTVSKKIVGSFSFTATEFPIGSTTANLTSGSFTIFY